MRNDKSYGWDNIADEFIKIRSNTGANTVREWSLNLPSNAHILDIGAGSGIPITQVLADLGLTVSAIDASPKLAKAFKSNFPTFEIACEPIEESQFFNQKYDGILVVGLMFLLPKDVQNTIFSKIADALKVGGSFLFSAPTQKCSWEDLLTGQKSYSLGIEAYTALLDNAGLELKTQYLDEGENNYYEAEKR